MQELLTAVLNNEQARDQQGLQAIAAQVPDNYGPWGT